MRYYVRIEGKEFEIDLSPGRQGLVGLLDGKKYEVDHSEIERDMKYSVIIDGNSYNVSMNLTPSGEDLIVGGRLYHAEVLDERERAAQALEAARGAKGPQIIESVMPGIVKSVFVHEGDQVSSGTPLLILEAMKMENELCAEKGGHVKKVHISEGQTVNSNDPLVTIE